MLAALVAVSAPSSAGADVAPIKVLIVGDSISQGSSGDWTWRYRLAAHLDGAGVAVDFVGPRQDLFDNVAQQFGASDYLDPSFDLDHAARWGMRLDTLDIPISTLVSTYQPDVVVEMLGDNDLSAGQSASQVADSLDGFVAEARSVDPSLEFVLTHDPRHLLQPEVPDFNAAIDSLAAQLDSPESPVVVAEAAAGFDDYTDTWDGAHPNARGELKIAAAIADALSELGIGPPAARPLPEVPLGPRVAPVLSGTATADGADLEWVRSPGSATSEVWARDLTAATDWQRLAGDVTGTTYQATGFAASHVLEFQTRPRKGFLIAQTDAWSNVLQVEVLGPTPEPEPGPTNVLLVGDSGTIGSTGDSTWRARLWRHLAATAPGQVDFVGPHRDLYDVRTGTYGHHSYVRTDFDRDHAARWGLSLAYPEAPIGELVGRFEAQVVVEMLGINDLVAGGRPPATVAADLRGFVADARAADPEIDVVLGEVTQTWAGGVADYNALLHQVASDLNTPTARVVVAETADGFRRKRDTYDGSHANARGEVRISAAIGDALADIGLGSPATRPLPQVPVGPRTAVRLTGKVRRGRVLKLAWTASPGASAYRVLMRRPAVSKKWRRVEETARRRMTLRGLADAGRVQVVVLPRKGWNLAAFSVRSNRVRVRF